MKYYLFVLGALLLSGCFVVRRDLILYCTPNFGQKRK
jgi:hypothetical protein